MCGLQYPGVCRIVVADSQLPRICYAAASPPEADWGLPMDTEVKAPIGSSPARCSCLPSPASSRTVLKVPSPHSPSSASGWRSTSYLASSRFTFAAAILQIEFGDFGTAVLKLAAVFSAPAAAGALVPIEVVGWLFSIVLYWVLLAWLFSLEARDLFVSVVILFLIRLVGGVVTAAIVSGLLM